MADSISQKDSGYQNLTYLPHFFDSFSDGPRKEVYFIALIDILTRYNMKKRTAQAAKTVKHGTGAEISTVRPDQYAKRFMEFISKCIE